MGTLSGSLPIPPGSAWGHLGSPALFHLPASLRMAPVPLWAELLGSPFTGPVHGRSWWAEPQSNPVCAQSTARSQHRVGALGFLTGHMDKGECWRNPTEELRSSYSIPLNREGLLFNSLYFPIIRTNSLLAQFPFPVVEGTQETSPKTPSPIPSLSRPMTQAALHVSLQTWRGCSHS